MAKMASVSVALGFGDDVDLIIAASAAQPLEGVQVGIADGLAQEGGRNRVQVVGDAGQAQCTLLAIQRLDEDLVADADLRRAPESGSMKEERSMLISCSSGGQTPSSALALGKPSRLSTGTTRSILISVKSGMVRT